MHDPPFTRYNVNFKYVNEENICYLSRHPYEDLPKFKELIHYVNFVKMIKMISLYIKL